VITINIDGAQDAEAILAEINDHLQRELFDAVEAAKKRYTM
jgi:hypothetical protein